MRYLLLIYENEARYGRLSEAENAEFMGEYGAFTRAVKEGGAFAGADRLRPTTTATSVRIRDGQTLVTDGPYAETKEQLGGYFVVEAADLDEAIAWAERIPSARVGTVEIRPVWEMACEEASVPA